jgi:hypothetical protein
MYSITVRRIALGELLKSWNRFFICRGYGATKPHQAKLL